MYKGLMCANSPNCQVAPLLMMIKSHLDTTEYFHLQLQFSYFLLWPNWCLVQSSLDNFFPSHVVTRKKLILAFIIILNLF